MTREFDPELEVEGEQVTTDEDDLLFSEVLGTRVFSLNNTNGTTLVGVVVSETDDSFMVGLPARLLKTTEGDNERFRIEPFSPEPYIRLIKYNVTFVTFAFGIFKTAYDTYLDTVGRDDFPELIEDLLDSGYDLESSGVRYIEEKVVKDDDDFTPPKEQEETEIEKTIKQAALEGRVIFTAPRMKQ